MPFKLKGEEEKFSKQKTLIVHARAGPILYRTTISLVPN